MNDTLLEALRAALGEAQVLSGASPEAQPYTVDWRKRYRGRARAVVRPGSTAEVAAVVRLCASHATPIVTQGGNTGLVGASVPDESGRELVLNLGRMQRVLAVDAANLSLSVEAGCVLATAQDAAAASGLLLPLSLAAEGSCTIGGNLASNAGGTQVLRYGNARDLCLGLEVVTAQGEVWRQLNGLRKNNAGYDLRQVFIGSEGTLGIITAATLKLFARPRARLTALARARSMQACVDLLRLLRDQWDAGLTAFEVMAGYALKLVATHHPQLAQPWRDAPWTVLLELSESTSESEARLRLETALGQALERGLVDDVALAQSGAQAHAMWQLRESIPLAQAAEGLNVKHDIALPTSLIPAFVVTMQAELEAALPGLRLVTFGHLGDGNLHYNVQAPQGADAAEFLRTHEAELNRRVYDAVMARGGSIAAEHGVGRLKCAELAARTDPVALALMRRLKHALDPHGLLNPGRVLSASTTAAGP